MTAKTKTGVLIALALTDGAGSLSRKVIEPLSEMLGVQIDARLTVHLTADQGDEFAELARSAYKSDVAGGSGVMVAPHRVWLEWRGVDIEVRYMGALTEDQRNDIIETVLRRHATRRAG